MMFQKSEDLNSQRPSVLLRYVRQLERQIADKDELIRVTQKEIEQERYDREQTKSKLVNTQKELEATTELVSGRNTIVFDTLWCTRVIVLTQCLKFIHRAVSIDDTSDMF